MKRRKPNTFRRLRRWSALLPGLFIFQQLGCLPDGALQQVFSENVLFSSAVVIQSVTRVIFNTFFGLAFPFSNTV